MFQSYSIDSTSVVKPVFPAADLLKLAERLIEQNDKILDANCKLLAVIGSPPVITLPESSGHGMR